MNKKIYTCAALLILSTLACGLTGPASQPKSAVAPITLGNDLTAIDVCKAIPKEDIEAVMGRKLTRAPQSFDYYSTAGTSGCIYDAGKDSSGEAHFGYVVLTPVDVYSNQPLYQNKDASGLGESAYFNNGADASQLWVKVNDHVAFVVAFGDSPNEEGATAIAKLVLAAIK
jgi:predicted small lipoprotein YifL